MSETKQLPAIPTNLPPAIVSKFNVALTSSKFQDIANEETTLVYNEDNVNQIKEFLDKTKKVTKAIEETHKTGKADALKIGREWDESRKVFLSQVDAITELPQRKYTELCNAIAKKQQEAAADKLRKENIQKGIETNAVTFAKQIADAKTTAELTRIESIINLEKGRKEKYQEFLPDAIEKFTALNANLKTQKEAVKELERLELEKQEALSSGNDEAALEIMERQEAVESKIEEQKINVQETAVNTTYKVIEVESVLPTVKAKRTTVKWEIKDLSIAAKKQPDWVKLTTVDEPIDKFMNDNKKTILEKGELEINGILFYAEKTY